LYALEWANGIRSVLKEANGICVKLATLNGISHSTDDVLQLGEFCQFFIVGKGSGLEFEALTNNINCGCIVGQRNIAAEAVGAVGNVRSME
jgi:hypothetical protein